MVIADERDDSYILIDVFNSVHLIGGKTDTVVFFVRGGRCVVRNTSLPQCGLRD